VKAHKVLSIYIIKKMLRTLNLLLKRLLCQN